MGANDIAGMESPRGIEDEAVRSLIEQLQENMTRLQGRCDALKAEIDAIEIPGEPDQIPEMKFVAGRNVSVVKSGRNIVIDAPDLPDMFHLFEVIEVKDDYLECKTLKTIDDDGNSTTEDKVANTPVAKPWLLRKTPFDGKTRNEIEYEYDGDDPCKRTAKSYKEPEEGEDPETDEEEIQSVTPSYLCREEGEEGDGKVLTGEIITAVRCDTLLRTEVAEGSGDKPIPIRFQEINLGGRCWAVDDSEEEEEEDEEE